MLVYILFVLGFMFLIKGADFLVDGASAIAKRLHVSEIVIGLTIVSFGTSAPELIVNLFAGASGHTDLAMGNILGSNISNVFLILGISALIYPLRVNKNTVWKEIPFSLLAGISVAVLANDFILNRHQSALTRGDGLVLIILFLFFIFYTFSIAKVKGEHRGHIKRLKLSVSILYIFLGLVGLALGGRWIVDGATHIAQAFGMSQSLIGLTIVAVGTSLPELATSAVAACKKNADIAIGNVLGSNIFNLLWILGLGAIIRPIPLNPANNFDIGMMIFSSVLLFGYLFIGQKRVLQRWQGISFLVIYALYVVFLIIRG